MDSPQADSHENRVASVASKVKGFHERKEKYRIYHGSTNSTRAAFFDRDRIVDTSSLKHVLRIDKSAMTALVEPNVALDALVEATLPYGLVPPVVMEFPGITVGGGFSGTSAESSSFKHGLFDHTIVSIEIVLANGEVVKASESERTDLFHGASGAFGTLGVLTLLEIKLVPASEYVKVTYHPIETMSQALETIDSCIKDKSATDFVDGVLYSQSFGLIMQGRMVDDLTEPLKTVRFTRRTDPWFYLHARRLFPQRVSSSSPQKAVSEYVPLRDYLFRYDRGGFWTAKYAFDYFFMPFNRVTRWLLDSWLHTRTMYHALHASGLAQRYVAQDVCVPASRAQELLAHIDEPNGLGSFYPLWLCPLPGARAGFPPHPHLGAVRQDFSNPAEREWTLNFGVWGPVKGRDQSREKFVAVNRDIEHKVRELHGVKTLYAHAYYTQQEFDEIYATAEYNALRAKYGAQGLPSVFEKVGNKEDESVQAFSGLRGVRPIGGLIGVVNVMLGRDYMLAKKKKHRQKQQVKEVKS